MDGGGAPGLGPHTEGWANRSTVHAPGFNVGLRAAVPQFNRVTVRGSDGDRDPPPRRHVHADFFDDFAVVEPQAVYARTGRRLWAHSPPKSQIICK